MDKEKDNKNKQIVYIVCWIIIFIAFGFLACSEKNLIGFQVKKILAENGNVDAQNILGNMYFDGDGVERNYEESLKWYKMAADKGDSKGQNSLGYMYSQGLGVEKNEVKAFEYYKKSAEQGNDIAQYNLFSVYNLGQGANVDKKEALRWLTKSAENGNSKAQGLLGYILQWRRG